MAAAHRVAALGGAPILFEKAARLGGKITTELTDGFLIEGGPDSFVVAKGAVAALAEELGISDQVISTLPDAGTASVWSRGRMHPLPAGLMLIAPSRLGPVFRSSLLSPVARLRLLGDLVLPRNRDGGDESLASFVSRRMGREVLERIAEPLIAGIHAARPETMSVRASFPRLLDMERTHRSLIKAGRAAVRSSVGAGSSPFASFRGGLGSLTVALSDSLAGRTIKTETTVSSIGERDGGWRVSCADGSDLDVAALILATPAADTARLLSDLAPRTAAMMRAIRQVNTATVTLIFRTDRLPRLPGTGFVVPAIERRGIMGASYLSNKWEGRTPDEGSFMMRAFVGGENGQELALADDETVTDVVTDELGELAGIEAQPEIVRIHRFPAGMHQYTIGHLDRLAAVEQNLTAYPNLAIAGAALYGIGLNECIASGRAAGERVMAHLHREVVSV
jgi:oxygen-dependent protoporphyrinogen oxidase